MKKRSDEINQFLKWFSEYYQQHPEQEVNDDHFYNALKYYACSTDEVKNGSIAPLFSKWKDYFKNNLQLHVYSSEKQPGFLQFANGNQNRHVKIVLSFPKEKIEEAVIKIMDFIAEEQMPTKSKVATAIRADGVILRMANFDDALSLLTFLKKEDFKMAKSTNPFMFREGVAAVTYDNYLSYNRVLSVLLERYFKMCRRTKALKKVSYKHFREYAKQFVEEVFRNPKLIEACFLSSGVKPGFNSVGAMIVNYEQVLRLILLQLDDKMNMQTYQNFYQSVRNDQVVLPMEAYYNELMKNYRAKENNELNNGFAENLLVDYINYIYQQNDMDAVFSYLSAYMNGFSTAITRKNNYRQNFLMYLPPSEIARIVKGDLKKFLDNYAAKIGEVSKIEVLTEETKLVEEEPSGVLLLNDYIRFAISKYGIKGAATYLRSFVEGNILAITRTNNFRDRFYYELTPQAILEITQNDLLGYIESYANKFGIDSESFGGRK